MIVNNFNLLGAIINPLKTYSPLSAVMTASLVDDFENGTKEIADFCGLTWHQDCLNFHRKRSKNAFTFSELQVREAVNKDGIGRWKAYEAELAPLLAAWKV